MLRGDAHARSPDYQVEISNSVLYSIYSLVDPVELFASGGFFRPEINIGAWMSLVPNQ